MSLVTMGIDLVADSRAVAGAAGAREDTTTTKALDALAKFIPAEVLAPYVTIMTLIGQPESAGGLSWDPVAVYRGFVIATPLLFILFETARRAAAGEPWPDFWQLLWRAVAAAIAFAVWSLAVPGNPYQEVIGIVAAGALAVLVSPVLWAVDAIVLRLLRDRKAHRRRKS